MVQRYLSTQYFRSFVLSVVLLSTCLLDGGPLLVSYAQVATVLTPDRTLGTTVTRHENVYTITGGTRPGNGPNLFHSFDRFSVGRNDIARFHGPQVGITNILSRVTGGQQSMIFGTVQSKIPGANLFLLNPAGVIFGPAATLDVEGSFHISTADYIRLGTGGQGGIFSANSMIDTVLTVDPPEAFGFLRENPAMITIQGNIDSVLKVPAGKTLSLIGGNIEIAGGFLNAPSGQIHIASIASPGEVISNSATQEPALQVDTFKRLGEINVSQEVFIDASGDSGGTVVIRGGRLLIDRSFVSADTFGDRDGAEIGVDIYVEDLTLTAGAQITSSTFGAGQGGIVKITATNAVTIDSFRVDSNGNFFQSGLFSGTRGSGAAGGIVVKTGQLALTEGGVISGSSFTDGLGGTVEVTATDAITISGGSALFSNAFGNGNAGKIAVTAPTIRMQEGGIQAFTVGKGIAGNILVEVGTLTLTDGANINSVTIGPMPGAGRGGTVRVNADSITIAGRSSSGSIPGLFSVTQGSGDAGSIEVKTRRLTLTESGEISSSTFGAGLGGTVTVNATESVTIDGFQVDLEGTVFPSGLFSITKGSGQGGNIHLQAPHIQLTDRAVITAESTGTNNAGTITITAHEMFLSGNSAVTTEAQKTDGGDITLNAQALVRLRDSKITATVGGGKNTVGGNIAIDPEFVILENSEIKANAFEGRGGNIRISAGLFLADPASRVSASSARGIDGEVDIRAPIADLSGSLTQLPQTLLSAAALLRQRCAERLSGGQTSSFVLRGRDGLPLEPSNLLPSPLPVIGETATQVLGNRREMRSMNTSRISLLSPEDKRLPTVGGINVQGFSQAAWDVGCSRW